MQRPEPTEHAEYYGLYIEQIPDGDICDILNEQLQEVGALLSGIDEAKAGYRYGPDKWSIKEVVGHLLDTERAFAFRAMAFARNEQAPIPGLEQDDYVAAANFDSRTIKDLTTELEHMRKANVIFFRSIDDETSRRRGMASDCEFTVRALAYITAGHTRHHLNLLRERYL